MRYLLILITFLYLAFPCAVYSAQNRVALVVGNGAYRDAPLRNPVNDARLMRKLLRKAGFSVTIVENARKKELINAIRSFGRSLRNADAALFYFSGHGNQHKSLNWLIPIGVNIQRESDLEFEAINAERILAEMEGGSSRRVNIVIFDACRANRRFRSFRSYNKGFAYPKAQSEGSIVAFSTAPGTVAYDGAGSNSPYVAELSKHMLTPGLKIEDVFKRVRVGVKNRTARKASPQIPWENSALMGDFYFVGSGGEPTPEPAYTSQGDKEAWEIIKDSQDEEDFKLFLSEYPRSKLVGAARIKLKKIQRRKNKISQQPRPESYSFRPEDINIPYSQTIGTPLNTNVSCDQKLGIGRKRIRKTGSGDFSQWFTRNNQHSYGESFDETVVRYEKTYGCRISERERKKFNCHHSRGLFSNWYRTNKYPWESYEDAVARFGKIHGCKLTKCRLTPGCEPEKKVTQKEVDEFNKLLKRK